ncbi:MAG: DUF4337 domain-containing protein [Acidobacteriota bacterium]|nr:DUF4337 domain-containing protein [Acidobacteriota bacterium]
MRGFRRFSASVGRSPRPANAVDQWSYYPAKGMKLNLAESVLDQLAPAK